MVGRTGGTRVVGGTGRARGRDLGLVILGDVLTAVLLGLGSRGGRRLVRGAVDRLVVDRLVGVAVVDSGGANGLVGVAAVVVLAGRGINLNTTLSVALGRATEGTTNRAGNTALGTSIDATLSRGARTSLNATLSRCTDTSINTTVATSCE